MAPVVGVLALQGAFREHIAALHALGVQTRELRQKRDLAGMDALVIPGGESTTIGRLLVDLDMLDPLRQAIAGGMPAYGSCAGLILLCREIEGFDQPVLGLLDARVRRNAFGRQAESFESGLEIAGISGPAFPAVFIRAPVISSVGPGVEVLATVGGSAVAVRQGNILATSFHPELTDDARVHGYFLDMCAKAGRSG